MTPDYWITFGFGFGVGYVLVLVIKSLTGVYVTSTGAISGHLPCGHPAADIRDARNLGVAYCHTCWSKKNA